MPYLRPYINTHTHTHTSCVGDKDECFEFRVWGLGFRLANPVTLGHPSHTRSRVCTADLLYTPKHPTPQQAAGCVYSRSITLVTLPLADR